MVRVKMAWERLLVSFILVDAVALSELPAARRPATSV